jgi:WD40 repeat protein
VNHHDGTLVLGWEGECQMWKINLASETIPLAVVRPEEGEMFHSASLSRSDGSLFILTTSGGRLYPSAERGRFRKVTERAALSAASPAGNLIAVARGPQLSLVSTTTWKEPLQTALFEHGVKRMEFSPDGTLLAVSTCGNRTALGEILFFDAESCKPVGRVGGALRVDQTLDFRFHPDGKSLMAIHTNGIRQWNVAALKQGWRNRSDDWAGARRDVISWEPPPEEEMGMMQLARSADGRKWGVIDGNSRPFVFEISAAGKSHGDKLLPFTVTPQQTNSACLWMAFSPDASQVAIKRHEVLEIYNVAGRALEHQFRSQFGSRVFAYAPDGRSFAHHDFAEPRQITVRGCESGEVTMALPLTGERGKELGVTAVAYSPNAEFLVAAVSDGADAWTGLQIWNLATARLVGSVQTARGVVKDLAFRPDGQRLVTLNSDRSITMWDFAAITRPAVAK